MELGSNVCGKVGQNLLSDTSKVFRPVVGSMPHVQVYFTPGVGGLVGVGVTVTRGSALMTQLCSPTEAPDWARLLVDPEITVVSCGPNGSQPEPVMQAVTGAEPELVAASARGSFTPVASVARRGAVVAPPLVGAAPNCRILPVPGLESATKA